MSKFDKKSKERDVNVCFATHCNRMYQVLQGQHQPADDASTATGQQPGVSGNIWKELMVDSQQAALQYVVSCNHRIGLSAGRQFKGSSANNGVRHDESAWKVLVGQCDRVSTEARKLRCAKLANLEMKRGQDPKHRVYAFSRR